MNHSIVPYSPVVADLQQERYTDQMIHVVNQHYLDAKHKDQLRQIRADNNRQVARIYRNLSSAMDEIERLQCERKNRAFQAKLYSSLTLAASSAVMIHVPIVSVCCLIGAVGMTGAWSYEWIQCRKRRR